MSFSSYMDKAPLGKEMLYEDRYNKKLLCPLLRSRSRKGQDLSFFGYDIWRAYELSWLNSQGRPEIAIAHFIISCNSPYLIESKSFKLYLHSFSQTHFESVEVVVKTLKEDLTEALGLTPEIIFNGSTGLIEGVSLDTIQCPISAYEVEKSFLRTSPKVVSEALKTDLFRSLCPVTGQPDFATIGIFYQGSQIEHRGLLQYLISYRKHAGLHEQCIEQIYSDIGSICKPDKLTVTGYFTRRGGLDINPCRSSHDVVLNNIRVGRQ